jgi:predicted transcriptional regulator
MIDFACKQFKIDQVIKCGLGLSKADSRLMYFLLEHSEDDFTTDDLAKKLKMDISTIQRAVKKLHEKEIIFRTQNNLSGGGYEFVYRIKSKAAIRKIIMNIVDGWAKKVETELGKW